MVKIETLPKQAAEIALATLLFVASALLCGAQEAKAPPPNKGRALIEQAIEALGGQAFLDVTEIVREGRIYGFSRGQLASPGQVFIEYFKLPDKWRREYGKRRNIIYVNNGEEGWELDPQGIREQTPQSITDFHESLKHDIDILLRRRRTEPGVQFYYLGSEFISNRRVDIVEMVDAENESYIFYLDAQTHLPAQLRYRERDELTGEVVPVTEYYGTYLNIQGVRTARQITGERAGRRTFEAFLSKVEYNSNISEELYTRESLEDIWRKIAKKQKKKKKKKDDQD
ncbi:MAG: hypothetical protein ACE5H2_04390 [Terriglobia bacterium]